MQFLLQDDKIGAAPEKTYITVLKQKDSCPAPPKTSGTARGHHTHCQHLMTHAHVTQVAARYAHSGPYDWTSVVRVCMSANRIQVSKNEVSVSTLMFSTKVMKII